MTSPCTSERYFRLIAAAQAAQFQAQKGEVRKAARIDIGDIGAILARAVHER